MLSWNNLSTQDEVDEIVKQSHERYQLILKHSTTCPISSMAKNRLESNWSFDNIDTYYLDLLAYRPVSNYIAEHLEVHHESPQVILLHNGEVVYDASHLDISNDEIAEVLSYREQKAK